MISFALWFAAGFGIMLAIVTILNGVKFLFGPAASTAVGISMLILIPIDIFVYPIFPEYSATNLEFAGYMIGFVLAMILDIKYIEGEFKERIQVDGEPRFK